MISKRKNLASILLCGLFIPANADEKRPNFVWFMTEDVSKHYLSIYNNGEYGAATPNVRRLAENGIIFNNAYSCAPVSSAARTSLFTSCYAPGVGCSFHRRLKAVNLPGYMRMFPSFLRDAGYLTLNSTKTDYNCIIDTTAWDNVSAAPGDWRRRASADQPFFFVRTEMCSHESCLHFKYDKQEPLADADPNDVFIHPNHPDTPLMRYTYARFYDKIEQSDQELGKLIGMLEDDGLLDDTFIFYFGDNGGSLPGTKGYTAETGLNVPLVIYIPEKWKSVVLPGQVENNSMVSFLDFGPTLLHLAGIEIPEWMDGRPFLGEDIQQEELSEREIYCYGDRFDELYAFNRTLRRGNFKYSRNFQPYHSKSLYSFYRYKQEAFAEWKKMFEDGHLNDIQASFFLPQGPEELYDLSADPYETRNLASDPEYRKILLEMRSSLKLHMLEKNDLGLIPECKWILSYDDPVGFGKLHSADIARYSDIADIQMLPAGKARRLLKVYLESDDPVDRYWAATACAWFGKKAAPLKRRIESLLDDEEMFVRSRAAVALSRAGDGCGLVKIIKDALADATSGAESLLIMNDMAYLKEAGFEFGIKWKDVPKKTTGIDWRINYLATPSI